MGVKTGACLVLKMVEHVEGTPYPNIDFSAVEPHIDMARKSPKVAASNEEIAQLITMRRLMTKAERVMVAYYAWE